MKRADYTIEELKDMIKDKKLAQKTHKKRKLEFSKLLVIVVLCMGLFHQNWSYRLAEKDKDTNSAVTVSITTVIISTCLGYLLKSAYEKKSRNDNGLDENGVPYDLYYKELEQSSQETIEKEGEI